MVALLFSTGQHRKGIEVLIQHTVNPKADREKMISGLQFDKDELLLAMVNWDLGKCSITTLPGSFSALVCTDYLYVYSIGISSNRFW